MSEFEDGPLELDADVNFDAADEGGDRRRGREDKMLNFRREAIRNLQRARKRLGDEGVTSDYLLQSAIVWAILELADAMRAGGGSAPGLKSERT